MLRDGRLNLGELTLPVAIDKLPQSYSMLSTEVSTFSRNFFDRPWTDQMIGRP